jgi:hypothetical protein
MGENREQLLVMAVEFLTSSGTQLSSDRDQPALPACVIHYFSASKVNVICSRQLNLNQSTSLLAFLVIQLNLSSMIGNRQSKQGHCLRSLSFTVLLKGGSGFCVLAVLSAPGFSGWSAHSVNKVWARLRLV